MNKKAISFGGETAAQIVKVYTTTLNEELWLCFRKKVWEHVEEDYRTTYDGCSGYATKRDVSYSYELKEIGATLSKGMASLCHKMDKAEISEYEPPYYYPDTTFDGYTLKGGVTILFKYRYNYSSGYYIEARLIRSMDPTWFNTILVRIDEKHGEEVSQNFIAAVRDWQENFEEYMRAIENAIEAQNKEIKKAKVEATARHAVTKAKMKQEGWAFKIREESEKETRLSIRIGDNNSKGCLHIKLEHKDFVNQLDKAVERIRPVLNALKNIDDTLI